MKRALQSVRSLSAEVGHYMEEEVLKLDITWKRKKSSKRANLVKRGLVVVVLVQTKNIILPFFLSFL